MRSWCLLLSIYPSVVGGFITTGRIPIQTARMVEGVAKTETFRGVNQRWSSRPPPRTLGISPLFVSETSSSVVTTEASFVQEESVVTDTTLLVESRRVSAPSSLSSPQPVPWMNVISSMTWGSSNTRNSEYQRGLITIAFITLLFSSNSPVLHAAFAGTNASPPPVLLLNAAVSVVALVGLLLGGETLESNAPLQSNSLEATTTSTTTTRRTLENVPENSAPSFLTLQAGCELGVWKFLGTTANLFGLALTTAGHGALLIQLTTLIVPVVQGIQGVPIPQRIQVAVVLALAGVVCFTQDPTGTPSAMGDALCVLAAIFYATYDLRLFAWGKRVAARELITTKIAVQALLSVVLLVVVGGNETMEFWDQANTVDTCKAILPVILWSGVAVNAVAPFLQVNGQQVVGPTRCQTIYASQPLWAAIISYFWLGETIGWQGMIGGTAFLAALFLAATTEAPVEDCGKDICEV